MAEGYCIRRPALDGQAMVGLHHRDSTGLEPQGDYA